MDGIAIAKEIIETYEDIDISRIIENQVFFHYNGNEYVLILFNDEERTRLPIILAKKDIALTYPHFMYREHSLGQEEQNKYVVICLREADTVVSYLMSYEEKIIDTIERFRHLLSLTPLEIEKEFQKEFLFYWNSAATQSEIELYLNNENQFSVLNAYSSSGAKMRAVVNGMKLNDKDRERDGKKVWNFQHDTPFYFIPIIDNRRIIPPTPYSPWSEKNIIQIIHGREFSCISHDTFEQIKHEQVRANKAGLVFQMHVDGNDYAFCCMVTFKNGTMTSLFEKLTHSITTIEIVHSKRADFAHLCRSIGNDASIADQRVLLIGCGSLGSYLAEDLVKVGFRSLDIYDNETLSNENILRHRLDGFWIGHLKTSAMKAELEMIHPEVCINAFNVRMDENQLARVADDFDLVIFTVGSSDVQLSLNRLLFEKHFAKPVIFTWLEAGGVYSHILYVKYRDKGCFECLYTDTNGELVNIKVNHVSEDDTEQFIIRNGCGATRVAYGTEILLRTTSAVLNLIQKINKGEIISSSLINIDSTSITNVGNTFAERKCACCGDSED